MIQSKTCAMPRAAAAASVSLAVLALAACGSLSTLVTRVPLPSEVAPASNQKLELIAIGEGAQVYRCDARAGAPGAFEWVFQAPEAILRDPAGRYLGKHYAGPTWELEDGSKVVGTVESRRDAPGAAYAIPWLRLKATATGAGRLSGVTTVVRAKTENGLAPSAPCNDVERGRLARVPYVADYYFYVTR